MVESEQCTDCEDPDISQLKEWLSNVNGEYRAYIKGALKALLFVQEVQNLVIDSHGPGFRSQRGD